MTVPYSTTGPLLRTKYQNRNTGERTAEVRANLYVEGDLDVHGEITQNGAPLETGGGESSLPYNTYVALLIQSDTDAPSATVLENTLGGTVVWARSAQGVYTATLTNGFPIGKTLVLIGANLKATSPTVLSYGFQSASVILLRSYTSAMAAEDDLLVRASIEIRVYP